MSEANSTSESTKRRLSPLNCMCERHLPAPAGINRRQLRAGGGAGMLAAVRIQPFSPLGVASQATNRRAHRGGVLVNGLVGNALRQVAILILMGMFEKIFNGGQFKGGGMS